MRSLFAAALILAGAAVAAAACAGAAPLPSAPGEEGAVRLYRSRCAACHRLYAPGERDASAWPGILARMAPRAHLSTEQHEQLERYLVAHGRRSP